MEEIKIFTLCFFVSFILCIIIIAFAKRYSLFIDSATSQKPQRFHMQETPRAGGIGIFIAFWVMLIYFYIHNTQLLFIMCGGSIIFASGLMEDFKGNLSPKMRLFTQCVATFGICSLLDVYLQDLSLGFTLPYIIGRLYRAK